MCFRKFTNPTNAKKQNKSGSVKTHLLVHYPKPNHLEF